MTRAVVVRRLREASRALSNNRICAQFVATRAAAKQHSVAHTAEASTRRRLERSVRGEHGARELRGFRVTAELFYERERELECRTGPAARDD
jgi:hypothetical protein